MISVLRQGHPLTLWCYDRPVGVPEGVELAPAGDILPKARMIRHHTGSVSLFSNWFRYELQRRGAGTWLDSDVYLLKPLETAEPYLLSEFEPGRINGGVLRIPPESPMLPPLLALFEEKEVPWWIPLRARLAAHWRLLRTGRVGLSKMPWGVAGPAALTVVAMRFGTLSLATPPDVHSPGAWQRADWIADPAIRLEDVITERTVSVHLWNERIKAFKNDPAQPGSFLARLQAEGSAPGLERRRA